MKFFLGSSGERLPELKKVAAWVKQAGHEAWPWNKPGLFPLGHYTFETLNVLKDKVDASIFIFGEDDEVWYRGDSKLIPRDNVLIEYGLFAGVLEPSRVAICKSGHIRLASDLLGVTYVDLGNPKRAREELNRWFEKIATDSPSLGRARLMAFQNKFSMPATNHYWRSLPENAEKRFVLLGGSNKSWIRHSTERRKSLGRSIVRIIQADGEVAMLCYDRKTAIDQHTSFFKDCILAGVTAIPGARGASVCSKLRKNLRFAVSNELKYQAVISDQRIVVMPLLNSPEFKEESLVFELSPAKHGEHHTCYQNDILRTVERNEIPGFIQSLCPP